MFLPAVVAGVATALMWGWVFNPRYGLVDGVLGIVGLQGPAWLRDPAWAMPSMVVIGLWNVGVNVVVYIAALGTVPRELHDAAALDGAGPVATVPVRHLACPPAGDVLSRDRQRDRRVAGVHAELRPDPGRPGRRDAHDRAVHVPDGVRLRPARVRVGDGRGVFVAVLLLTAIQFRVVGRRVPYLGADS